jgi:hypothetical protein
MPSYKKNKNKKEALKSGHVHTMPMVSKCESRYTFMWFLFHSLARPQPSNLTPDNHLSTAASSSLFKNVFAIVF